MTNEDKQDAVDKIVDFYMTQFTRRVSHLVAPRFFGSASLTVEESVPVDSVKADTERVPDTLEEMVKVSK